MTYTALVSFGLVVEFIPAAALLWLAKPTSFVEFRRSGDAAFGLGVAADTGRRLYLIAIAYGKNHAHLSVAEQAISLSILAVVIACIWVRLIGRVSERHQSKGETCLSSYS